MTSEESQRLESLCSQIKGEKDHKKFMKLIQELNDLLSEKENRLNAAIPSKLN